MTPPQQYKQHNLRGYKANQHGVNGAYVGGDWVDMEDCADQFSILDGSCGNICEACPRSRSRTVAAKDDGTYDVVVIGAGCVGGAIARELSKHKLSVLVVEAADDVTQGATKGNSGIVHAGFDDTPGTNRAKFCWPGNQMFAALDEDLHFGYQKNGSLVIATCKEEEAHLMELKKRGETNGVQRLRIINKKELFALEPYVNPKATAALLSPDAGNLIPYEYAIALLENAVDNGVELRIRREVTGITKTSTGGFEVTVNHWEPSTYTDTVLQSPNYVGLALGLAVVFVVAHFSTTIATVVRVMAQAQAQAGGVADAVALLTDSGLVQCVYGLCTLVLAVVLQQCVLSKRGPAANAALNRETIARAGTPSGEGGRKVTVDEMLVGGTGSRSVMHGVSVGTEVIKTRFVVNAAGSYSDNISRMIDDDSFTIKPRLGDYILLNRDQGHLATHTMFPCPGKMGKGVLVQTTLWGNLILGPTARDVNNPDHMNMSEEEVQSFILGKCSNLVPAFNSATAIHGFAGARAKNSRGDWIIEASARDPHFIHAAGIDSPGLAGSPAIAVEVCRLLQEAGCVMAPDPTFNPKRAPIISIKGSGWKGLSIDGKMNFTETDPTKNIVCKCEKVTEAEVVAALHRNLPIDSTQAIRKRTRAGMGHCQGEKDNYNCECRVAAIIARENKLPVEAVGRRPWPATTNLPQRWLGDAQRERLNEMQQSVDPCTLVE